MYDKMRMTKEAIRLCIKRKDLCDNPELNERVYLHNKGFVEIRNLEKYTQLRDLFIEGNELTKIENLDAQKRLRHLNLQKNKLERIENLDCCPELKYLDVSSNNISKIDDLSRIGRLESLVMKKNKLSKPDSIRNVVHIKRLRELDLSNNKINCSLEGILEILSQCKSLKILSLKGNPISKIKNYRKLVISRCLKLTQLDGNPICKEERRRCTSWGKVIMNGGSFDEADAANRQELNKIRSEQSQANAQQRSLHHGRDDISTSSKTIGSSVLESIKKAFGFIDSSRHASSNISWSSHRYLDHTHSHDLDIVHDKRLSMKKELEQVRYIVESQRLEIHHLKEQLGEQQLREEVGVKGSVVSPNHDAGRIEDSERDMSYSFIKNQEMAEMAKLGLMAGLSQSQPANQAEICTDVDFFATNGSKSSLPATQKQYNRSSTLVSMPGVQEFDPFSIFPPVPPPRNASM